MPNTDSYLILGIAVSTGILVLYVGMLVQRFRQTRQTVTVLETLANEDRATER